MKEQIQRTFDRANYLFAGNNEYYVELEWFNGVTFYGSVYWYLRPNEFKEEFNQLLLLYLVLSTINRNDINDTILNYLDYSGLSAYNENNEQVTKLYKVHVTFYDTASMAHNVIFDSEDLAKLNQEEILKQLLKLLEDYEY